MSRLGKPKEKNLKELLQKEGHKFASQADSEAIAHLVEKFYDGDLEKAVAKTLPLLKGAYGLAIIHKKENKSRYDLGREEFLKRVNDFLSEKQIRYHLSGVLYKELLENKTILSGSIERSKITSVTVYGPLLVLHNIAESLGLPTIFGEIAPYILSLVYAHCVEPGSLVSVEKWYSRTDLKHILGLESVTYDT